jgi:high-affinity iron transporter
MRSRANPSLMKKPALAALALVLAVAVAPALAAAQAAPSQPPSAAAEEIRSALVAAQLELDQLEAAQTRLRAAQDAYHAALEPALAAQAPDAHARAAQGFDLAARAAAAGRTPEFAAARAQVWTALLDGGHILVERAIADGDAAEAQIWLPLREFRRATRFARPNADATLALQALAAGNAQPAAALAAARADLLDTYQARLNAALADLAAAHARDFSARRAEAAALADGYFAILAPSFAEQCGVDLLADARQRFADLRAAAVSGQGVPAASARVDEALRGFRAAPLTEAEQARRAGQMMRYLKLVPIEYGRAIRNGEVAVDLEIREATTFRDGAQAAFDDLRGAYDARDAAKAAQAAELFAVLEEAIADASERRAVASPEDVRARSEQLTAVLAELTPTEWARQDAAADFDVVATALDQMEQAVAQGEYALAESARIEAYAVLESGPEAKIAAFAPQFKTSIEGYFWFGHAGAEGLAALIQRKASLEAVRAARASLDVELAQAQDALKGSNSPVAVATNSGIIVFREGLEAVLILAALMASFRTVANKHLRKPMWIGTALALAASVLTWLIMRGTISLFASFGEKLEAVVSIIAIGVLLLITNWFFHDVYWKGWMANFHKHKQSIIKGAAGQFAGLLILGFTSVYREGFETALFLQALTLGGGAATVAIGAVAGMALVMAVGLAIFALQAKLPIMKMLIFTGLLIGFVLLVMVGNTVHILQVVGWLPLTPIRWLDLPYWFGVWFGTYPTVEGLALQAAAAIFVIGSYILAERVHKRKVRSAAPPPPPLPATTGK